MSMQNIVDFIIELDKLKNVTRKNKPIGQSRAENSAEHTWQIAMLALAAQNYAQTPVNIDRVIKMLLIHDIGEIDTGDTIVYADIDWESEKQKELAAVKRIFSLMNQPQLAAELLALWQEFEAGQSDDAIFANALDRAMPPLLNLHSNGQSWVENGITYDAVVKRIKAPIVAGCPPLWAFIEERLNREQAVGWFGTRTPDDAV